MERIIRTDARPDKVPDQQADKAIEAALAAIQEALSRQGGQDELAAGLKGPAVGAPEGARRKVASSEAAEFSNIAARLEQDLFAAVHGAESSTESERELASTEIVLRLERDLRELIARSAHEEIRAVSRAAVMAQKTLAAQADAFRVPVAERYFPKGLKNMR
jgi:hypothetical protein